MPEIDGALPSAGEMGPVRSSARSGSRRPRVNRRRRRCAAHAARGRSRAADWSRRSRRARWRRATASRWRRTGRRDRRRWLRRTTRRTGSRWCCSCRSPAAGETPGRPRRPGARVVEREGDVRARRRLAAVASGRSARRARRCRGGLHGFGVVAVGVVGLGDLRVDVEAAVGEEQHELARLRGSERRNLVGECLLDACHRGVEVGVEPGVAWCENRQVAARCLCGSGC